MQNIIEIVQSHLKDCNWKRAELILKITKSSMKYGAIFYIDENGNQEDFWIDFDEIRPLLDTLRDKYNQSIDSDTKFNKYKIIIKNNRTYTERYWWDSEQNKQNLITGAEVFFQWANDRMMSMIFEFEQENNLLPTQYDSDDELEYLSSWDSGVFRFHINEKNELEYKIVLTKDGIERVLEMPLKDYFIEGILEHHQITNTELSDEWKSWNTLVIKSPHTGIPYDKVDQFVSYILE